MKKLNYHNCIFPLLIILLILHSSNITAQEWNKKSSILKQPEAGKFDISLKESIIIAQSNFEGSVIPQTPSLSISAASIFVITTTADTGIGSLRKAITDANNNAGLDIIQFNIPGPGVKTISPQSPLPYIGDPVIIDGTTQPGYSGMPLIELDGTSAGTALGLNISAGNSTIKGLIINRFSDSGILLWLGGGNVIEASFIGTDATGKIDLGNGGSGIAINSPNNKIGNSQGGINVISGNSMSGIIISGVSSSGNTIVNNFIGTSVDGNIAIENGIAGVYIQNSTFVKVGGTLTGEQNVISGNHDAGISIRGSSTESILVQGNIIGTESSGFLPLGNMKSGIEILPEVSTTGTPSYITIGGTIPSAKNIISGNIGGGVAFFQDGIGGIGNMIIGNLIGTNVNGTGNVANWLGGVFIRKYPANSAGILIGGAHSDSANVISGNNQFGIWLRGSGAKDNWIRGNYIGTTKENISGISALENQYAGIYLDNAPANIIGGDTPSAGNVISSNGAEGIAVIGDTANGNRIYNNFIGTNSNNTANLGNQGHGIYIETSQTLVGDQNKTNYIAHNKNRGIFIFSGTKNTIRFNSIHDNDSLGIDLSPERLTPNDRKDIDIGANNLQNFPLLDSASISQYSIHIKGKFDSEPNKEYKIDLYKNQKRNASHFGEGETYLVTFTALCDTGGRKEIDKVLPISISGDEFLTATATDSEGNTSEFSRALCLKDSDGDGIMDCWETEGDGIDVNADGIIDYDLWTKGARPDHKDIFVEVDWMNGFRPMDSSITMVMNAFKNVPNRYVHNPDSLPGIHLVAEVAEDSLPFYIWQPNPWPEFFLDKEFYFGTNEEWASPNRKNILEAKRLVYRYCVFGHSFNADGSSGLAEYQSGVGGNDFIVSLGKFTIVGGNRFQQAGTFMHELGHTLGLGHGGVDDIHYKPNYYSVMNYAWQFPKNDGLLYNLSWKLDYSPATLPTLIEDSLNEAAGMGPLLIDYPSPVLFPYSGPVGNVRIGILYPNAAVDWDGNGDSSGLASTPVDINNLRNPPGPSPHSTLKGHADWQNLQYNFRNGPNFLDPSSAVLLNKVNETVDNPEEMSPAIYDDIQSLPPYGIISTQSYPTIFPIDTIIVGGESINIIISLSSPAPMGGITYSLLNSDTTLLSLPSTITIPEGYLVSWVETQTNGVAEEQVVQITAIGGQIPVTSRITIQPADLMSFEALTDSGCAIMEQGGFHKKYLAGCSILFNGVLNGESSSVGWDMQVSSSRPDLINPSSTISLDSFSREGFFTVNTNSSISTPEMVILTASYRGISLEDTVTLIPAPVSYALTEISPPNYGGYNFQAINNAGDILMDGVTLYRNGVYIQLDTLPGFRMNGASGMNDIGWFYGAVWDTTINNSRPAYWKPDTTIILPTLEPLYPSGGTYGINNNGEVIGGVSALTFPYESKPVVWRNDSIIVLEGYFDFRVGSVAINDAGQIIGTGYYYNPSPYTNLRIAVRWDNEVLTPLFHPWDETYWISGVAIAANGTALLDGNGYMHLATNTAAPGIGPPPPYNRITPLAMNDNLEVVGEIRHFIEDVGTWYSCFIESNGYMYDLRCLGNFPSSWYRLQATGINNDGTIVGVAEEESGEAHVFVLNRSTPTSVEENQSEVLPNEFQLLQNYPNPFNPSTTIKYQLPSESKVTLTIYNVLGQVIKVLVDGIQTGGYKLVEWNASGIASGVYFYTIKAGNFIETKKMILLK